jgi:hypothetical protein
MNAEGEPPRSWLPMIVIAMGQTQMSLNVNAIPVSIGGIVAELNTAPTTVGTAIVANSVAIAGFAMPRKRCASTSTRGGERSSFRFCCWQASRCW